jgi:hypothetical protein
MWCGEEITRAITNSNNDNYEQQHQFHCKAAARLGPASIGVLTTRGPHKTMAAVTTTAAITTYAMGMTII